MLNVMTPPAVRWAVEKRLEELKLSTAEFAEKAELTYQQALNLRRGAYSRIDMDTLARVCEALDVEPGDILVLEDNHKTA